MSTEVVLLLGLFSLALTVLIGFFKTKSQGFGRFSTSLLLLTAVFFVAAMLLSAGKIEAALFGHIAFAIAGFAGGLFTGRSETAS